MEVNVHQVGQRIKSIRLSLGDSMESFGKRLNTSKASVNNWEKGVNLPNNKRLKLISEIAEITVEELLYGENFDKEYFYVNGIIRMLYLGIIKEYMPESEDAYESFIHEVTKIYLKDNKEPFSHSANNVDIKIFKSIYKALENEGLNISIDNKVIADLFITQLEITNAKTFTEISNLIKYIYGSGTTEERLVSEKSQTIYAELSYTLDDLKDRFKIMGMQRRSPIIAMPGYTYRRKKNNDTKPVNDNEQ